MTGTLHGLDHRLMPAARRFLRFLEGHGLQITITSTRRSSRKQAQLYREYLTARAAGRPHLPALPPGRSLHEKGLAWDMVVEPSEYQDVVGRLWERLGGQWGGNAPVGYDPVHFQAKQLA